MVLGSWLSLLARHTPGEIGWDEVVVGQDFGFLRPEEILAWAKEQPGDGEARGALLALEGDALETRLEATLWKAAAEATGRVPRPGLLRWSRAQDRWRSALLKDALEAPLSPEALGVAIERIYEALGCPEDMLGLWARPAAPAVGPAVGRREAVVAFLSRPEGHRVA